MIGPPWLAAPDLWIFVATMRRPSPVFSYDPIESWITRVPQFLSPSTVWLDTGGMYSVAIQTLVPEGSRTAHE